MEGETLQVQKEVKVIVVCGNPNRKYRAKGTCNFHIHPQTIQTIEDLHDLWDVILELERTVDGGMPFDTAIVCNGDEAYEWWKPHHGTKTPNGTLIVVHRNNHGGSFAGYDHVYRHMHYDGFLFTEEDMFIFGKDYYKRIKERFNEQPTNGFVCIVGLSGGKKFERHCHGGVGYTTRKILDTITDERGRLPYPRRKGWHQGTTILKGEIPFTANITKHGHELVELHEHVSDWVTDNLCMPYALFSWNMIKY